MAVIYAIIIVRIQGFLLSHYNAMLKHNEACFNYICWSIRLHQRRRSTHYTVGYRFLLSSKSTNSNIDWNPYAIR